MNCEQFGRKMTTTTIIITQKLENVLKMLMATFNHSIRYKVKAEVVHFDENGDGRVIKYIYE